VAGDQVTRSNATADTAASDSHHSTLTSPELHEKLTVSKSAESVLDETLPFGGFHLMIDGSWSEFPRSKGTRNLRLIFRGKWEPKPQLTHSTNITGTVEVEGLTDKATAMHGTLTAKLLHGPFDLCFYFVDDRGGHYAISASMQYSFHRIAKGQLKRGKAIIGEVNLMVSWKLVTAGLLSVRF
jgi:hypothetical protein